MISNFKSLIIFQVSEGEDSNPNAAVSSDNNNPKKTCADCGTSKTPLWRGGPAGPKVINH